MTVLPPGSTIGILGGGQLGRMLAMAAARLGLKSHIYADAPGPAFDVAHRRTIGAFEDLGAVRAFAETVDVVTYEFENVPLGAAAAAAAARPVRPGPRALEVSQDRIVEKRFVDSLGLPVAPFAAVDSLADLTAALTTIGVPAILKTCRNGYDGKGQARILSAEDPGWAWDAIGTQSAILEGFVPLTAEISILVVRSLSGQVAFYDVPRNVHRDGILATSTVPAGVAPCVIAQAHRIGQRIADALDYVGVLTVEMFLLEGPDGAHLVVNEMAPRVHNSGHWTLDACVVSQFENHVRAIAGWPLGSTARHCDAVMTNLIGADAADWAAMAARADTALHLYGKHDPRPGRKMGHATRIVPKAAALVPPEPEA
ncbi:MAG: 5-(carboxyamino)imidazole ribonucleotide synthase [Hyphomicrobiaceae bacterium]|nr:5-(carboxyamino)imidazole ribonucleotide synthase [Hyphomicrobiaceae bacterium]